jgi:YhcH/YjgK/YiaL family protein
MILDTLANADRYVDLHPLFRQAFDYMRSNDLKSLANGRHAIHGDQLFAIVERVPARALDVAQLECHRQYIDIQLVLAGVDTMGWLPLADCHQPVSEFNAEYDIQFFKDATDTWVATSADSFCIFFPDDAHAPLVGTGNIHKIVFKLAVNVAV